MKNKIDTMNTVLHIDKQKIDEYKFEFFESSKKQQHRKKIIEENMFRNLLG